MTVWIQNPYTRMDPAIGKCVLLGADTFSASGALTLRVPCIGNALSSSLTLGATESVDYTVKTLFPAGLAARYIGQLMPRIRVSRARVASRARRAFGAAFPEPAGRAPAEEEGWDPRRPWAAMPSFKPESRPPHSRGGWLRRHP